MMWALPLPCFIGEELRFGEVKSSPTVTHRWSGDQAYTGPSYPPSPSFVATETAAMFVSYLLVLLGIRLIIVKGICVPLGYPSLFLSDLENPAIQISYLSSPCKRFHHIFLLYLCICIH